MINKRILVTGPTGKIGKHLLKELINLKRVYEIRVLSLSMKKDKKILKQYEKDIEIIYGNITDIDIIRKVVKNVDAIVHLAGLVPPVVEPDSPLIEEINYGGTKLLVEEFEKENKEGIFIFLSSVSVYGRRVENPEIRITDPLKPNDAYGITKVKAENTIKNSSLNYIIYRFGAILSAGEELNSLIFLQPLETSLEVTCIEDVVYLIARSIDCSKLYKGIYNVAGGKDCRAKYKDLLNRNFIILGLGENFLPEEAFATKTMGHNGFYIFDDMNPVQEQIPYQRYTLEDYFQKKAKSTSKVGKFMMRLFRPIVRWYLLRMSEPYRVKKEENQVLIDKYFY